MTTDHKQVVLEKYPDAKEWRPLGGMGLICICRDSVVLGEAYTEEAAWQSAANKLQEKEHG